MKKIKAVCFGEVLYDVFPDGERIGGAPLNVASRFSALGIDTQMISKVGDDMRGQKIISYLQSIEVETANIKKDDRYPTGVVNVTLSKNGSATYDISYPSAWDKIEFQKEQERAVENADVFIYGSLVCRDEVSRKTLFQLLAKAGYRVLDFNLRPPHYSKDVLIQLIENVDFIKFNDDELFEVAEMLNSPFNSLEQNLHFIARKSSASTICVTKGRHGAVMLQDNKLFYNSGFRTKVEDTVGAGDSFLASLLAKLLQEKNPQLALNFACAVGALVAGEKGANPKLHSFKVQEFMGVDSVSD